MFFSNPVHNSVTDMVKDIANEPSVGLYFVQQHVHKAVPGLLALKVESLFCRYFRSNFAGAQN